MEDSPPFLLCALQLHKKGIDYRIFSRSGKDYSSIYRPAIDVIKRRECIKADKIILDGELVGYNSLLKRFTLFGTLKVRWSLHQTDSRWRTSDSPLPDRKRYICAVNYVHTCSWHIFTMLLRLIMLQLVSRIVDGPCHWCSVTTTWFLQSIGKYHGGTWDGATPEFDKPSAAETM